MSATPNDLTNAIKDGLAHRRTVEPPIATTYDELLSIIGATSALILHLKTFNEMAMAAADATSPYADRQKIARSAGVTPTQLGRILERNGRPRNRKSDSIKEN